MSQQYYIRSDRHFGIRTTMSIENVPYNLYTDNDGYLRQVKDSLGDPVFPQAFADVYSTFSPNQGWSIIPITDETPEVEYDILHILEDGYTAQVLTNSPITAKLRAATTLTKQQESIITQLTQEIKELKDQIAALKKKADVGPPAVVAPNTNPPAPAIENGKVKAPKKKPAPLAADDNSVASINVQEPEGRAVTAATDDIPGFNDDDNE